VPPDHPPRRYRPAASSRRTAGNPRAGRPEGAHQPVTAERAESDAAASRSRVFEPLLVGLVPSLLGLVAYAIVREGYVWMYERYGLSPEDVGIGQLQMASEMIRIVHLWVLDIPGSPATNFAIFFLFLGLLLAGGHWLRRRWRWLDRLAARHPVALGLSVLLGIVILTSGWAVPRDRDFAGRRLQLGHAVHPTQLAVLAIEADPARVAWTGGRRPAQELLTSRLVYLGKANGVLVLYEPPDWRSCPVHDCRGAVWKVNESDVLLRLEVNPPDRHAPKPSPYRGP
jgi:hypothetical protein